MWVVGGIAGGVASDSSKPNTVVIEQPPRRVIEEDTTGSVGCETTTVRERNSAGIIMGETTTPATLPSTGTRG